MKKITFQFKYIICAAAMTTGLTGCSDFLDILPMNEVVLENYWTEKSDVTSVVNSCYEPLLLLCQELLQIFQRQIPNAFFLAHTRTPSPSDAALCRS